MVSYESSKPSEDSKLKTHNSQGTSLHRLSRSAGVARLGRIDRKPERESAQRRDERNRDLDAPVPVYHARDHAVTPRDGMERPDPVSPHDRVVRVLLRDAALSHLRHRRSLCRARFSGRLCCVVHRAQPGGIRWRGHLQAAVHHHRVYRLGGKRWNRLHRLVYVSATAGVVHYWWLVKADIRSPAAYAGIVTLLLAFRVWWMQRRASLPVRPPAAHAISERW